jgi:glycosyltransferase involved in cell wall biosynthesis
MNVLLMTHRFPPDGVAGVERITEDLADGLAQRGEAVTVVTRQWSKSARIIPRWRHEMTTAGVSVERLPGVPPPLERPFRRQGAVTRSFAKAFAAARPDVVHLMHAHGYSPGCIELIVRERVPLVVSLQDFFFACPLVHLEKKDGRLCAGPDGGTECASTCFRHDPNGAARWALRAAFFRAVLAAAAEVVAPSKFVASYFLSEGAANGRVRVIANGVRVPEQRRKRPAPQSGRLRLAYIGAVTPHKGVHLIFQALASLPGRTVAQSLLVAGAEPDRRYTNRLRSFARQLPHTDVVFKGSYERSQLDSFLNETDIVIVPSRVPETFSMTVREAHARGVPVIVARIGALGDAIEEGVTGWGFEPDSADGLADVLERLASNPDQVARARDAVSRVHPFTIDQHTDAIFDLYQRAVVADDSGRASGAAELARLRQSLGRLS